MIAVVGESLVDLVHVVDEGPAGAGPCYRAMAGGSPFNVSVAAARLGVATRLYSRVGLDAFGRLLVDVAARDGVDVSTVSRAARWTGLAVTTVSDDGAASYEFRLEDGAGTGAGWVDDDLRGLDEASIIHFGSIASWHSPDDAVIRASLQRTGALISYDPNVRPALLASPGRARQVIEQNVALSDLVKASDEDLEWLYPGVPIAAIAERLLALGPALVVVTAGGHGATAFRRRGAALHRPAREVSVIDTVGAGDSSMAALLAGLHARGVVTSAELSAMSDDDLTCTLDDALLAAALTCARRGADPPTMSELTLARAETPHRGPAQAVRSSLHGVDPG